MSTEIPQQVVPALVMGILGGAHCVAMCGGVVSVLSAAQPQPARGSLLRQVPFVLAYNTGRIVSYTIAGLVAGGAGAAASAWFPLRSGQWILRLFAALTMLAVGLHLAGLFRSFRRLEELGVPLWRAMEPLARSLFPVRTPVHALALGTLWGWMPCGLVYSAVVLALGAGSARAGALTLLAFGLGTLPTLFTMGVLASGVAQLARRPWVRQWAGVLIATFGTMGLLSVLGFPLPLPLPPGPAVHCHCH